MSDCKKAGMLQNYPKKGKDMYARIKAVLAELPDDEKDIALAQMEEEGF